MEHTATVRPAAALSFAPSAATWLRLSVLYLVAGVALGIAMGATGNFTLRPVHAHLNLLGFTLVGLSGLVYSVYPRAAESRLAQAHFWLHNTGVPVMMGALAWFLLGHPEVVPVLAVAELVVAGGTIAFALNVFRNVTQDAARLQGRAPRA